MVTVIDIKMFGVSSLSWMYLTETCKWVKWHRAQFCSTLVSRFQTWYIFTQSQFNQILLWLPQGVRSGERKGDYITYIHSISIYTQTDRYSSFLLLRRGISYYSADHKAHSQDSSSRRIWFASLHIKNDFRFFISFIIFRHRQI